MATTLADIIAKQKVQKSMYAPTEPTATIAAMNNPMALGLAQVIDQRRGMQNQWAQDDMQEEQRRLEEEAKVAAAQEANRAAAAERVKQNVELGKAGATMAPDVVASLGIDPTNMTREQALKLDELKSKIAANYANASKTKTEKANVGVVIDPITNQPKVTIKDLMAYQNDPRQQAAVNGYTHGGAPAVPTAYGNPNDVPAPVQKRWIDKATAIGLKVDGRYANGDGTFSIQLVDPDTNEKQVIVVDGTGKEVRGQ